MTHWVVRSSTRVRAVVVGIGAVIIIAGVVQFRDAPVDVYPEFEQTRVVIQTEAFGLSAAEVERLVAVPLEEVLTKVAFLEEIRSESVSGLSVLTLVFETGTDILIARQLVQEPLQTAFTLPNVTKPPVMLQPLSVTNRVMMMSLTSEELSLIQMSVLARWNITPKLLGVPGVANVAVWGNRERQLQVQVDPELLEANGVSLDQVISTTGDSLWVSTLSFLKASVPGTGGWIDTPTQRLGIRHVLPISSPEDLANISVDGTTLRLGDISDVVEGHPPIIGDAFINNDPGLLLVVEKFPGADTLTVTSDIEKALDELRPGLSGIEIDTTVFRAASYIESATDNLVLAGLLGTVLVTLALALFLFNWRLALIGVVAIGLSLTAAVVVLLQLGATINLMVLVGLVIAIGAVVADAVISVENIARRLTSEYTKDSNFSTAAFVGEVLGEVRGAIIVGTLIGSLAVMPIFLLEGLVRSFYTPLALSYLVAIAASMLVALIFTPVLAVLLLRATPRDGREPRAVGWLRRGYDKILTLVVRLRLVGIVGGAILLAIGLAVGVSSLGGRVTVPAFEERDLRIALESAPGTSPSEMTRLMTQASSDLQGIPGINSVAGQIGRAETGDQVVATNSGQLWVNIDAGADYDMVLVAIQTSIDAAPGLEGNVQPYLTGRGIEAATNPPPDLIVRIYGPELDILDTVATDVKQILSSVDGLVGLHVDSQPLEPQVEIEVDLTKAQLHGIKPGDVRRAAATYFAGIPVGNLFEEQKVFEVSVWSKPEARGSLENLDDVLVDKPDGTRVRLADVAEVRMVPIPILIQHDAASAYIDVVADVSGRTIDAVVSDVEVRLLQIDFPFEYNPQIRAIESERQAPQTRIVALSVAAMIGIFLLLQLTFDSWRLAFLGLLALPAALSGGVVAAAWLTDGVTSLGALAGLLAVLGIAARSGVLLISHCLSLEKDDGMALGPELVLRAAREQFASIALIAVITALALLPVLVLGGGAGLELVNPMGIVLLGGLITTTLVYLFLVPALYLLFAPRHEAVTAQTAN